ncbi:IclR family transcriptional regulator [Comamonadaceae bacterium G21597-S1]|nr:IclR family transcriptional regulator [Comamonadaceae bacterium G21597-S1]
MNNTLLKGLEIVELLAHSDRPLTLTEMATTLNLAKSNVHRLLQALTERHYVIRQEDGNAYAASIKLWELGSAVLSKLDLKLHGQDVMEELLQRTGETVHLSVLDGDDVVYVHKIESPNPVRAYTQIGGRARAHCVATGKAMLAYRTPSALEHLAQSLVSRTALTITDPARFLHEMARIRAQGYGVNRGEWNINVAGIAAPIVDARGNTIAAVGLSGPKERFKPAQLKKFAPLVIEAAQKISIRLGGRRPLPIWR